MGTVARIRCPRCDESVDRAAPPVGCPRCRSVLDADVDLSQIARGLAPEIRRRPRGLWRWREFLPIADAGAVVTLGEGDTPLVPARRLGAEIGLERLYIKDDTVLPTGSLKDRSVPVALSHAREVKATTVAVSSTGNHAASVAAYAAAAALAGQGRIRPQDLVVCAVTGHGLKQPAGAAAHAEPLLTIGPSLSELEGHLRRNPL